MAERENGCRDKEGPKYCIVYTIPDSGLVHPIYGLGLIYFKSVMSAARVYYDVPELFGYLAQLTNWES